MHTLARQWRQWLYVCNFVSSKTNACGKCHHTDTSTSNSSTWSHENFRPECCLHFDRGSLQSWIQPIKRITIRELRENTAAVIKDAFAPTIPLSYIGMESFFPIYLATKRSISCLSSFLVRERISSFLSRKSILGQAKQWQQRQCIRVWEIGELGTVYKGCHSAPSSSIQVWGLTRIPCCNMILAGTCFISLAAIMS